MKFLIREKKWLGMGTLHNYKRDRKCLVLYLCQQIAAAVVVVVVVMIVD
jgi:hypothetical protein